MKIGLRGGHSPRCKGKVALRDEQVTMRELCFQVKGLLEQAGHTVINCNSDASTERTELAEGTNKANNAKCDVYIPLHMNAFGKGARGVEAWCYNSNSGIANQIAKRFTSNVANLGIPNRGVKYNTGYHDLKASAMPAVILEYCFCDNEQDIAIWARESWDTLARCVANAIDPKIPLKVETKPTLPDGFDPISYLVNNLDVLAVTNANSTLNAKDHYLGWGYKENRKW